MRAIGPDDLQDYIEDRLDDRRCRAVLAYLARHPEQAVEVEALHKQAKRLRRLGPAIVGEPSPRRLLDIVRRLKR